MAGDGGGLMANNGVELEAMHKEDSSWHPCQVSLCPSGVGLIVDYGEHGFKDIIVTKEEAISRLRVRSVPIQGDDCSEIQQGDHILATQQSESRSLFFDAEVEKALRVRHSKRVHCRCTFIIKWLHQELKETFVVSSSSIMKLAIGNIISHPTISAFMNTVEPLICSSVSTFSTVVNDMDDEMDLHDLLEKQIEEINNSANLSKKTIAEDILFGVEVGTKGQLQCKTIATSKISYMQPPSDRNQMMRSTRSRSKLQTEIEVKVPSQAAPCVGEELIESRSPLNPLAARAALASLMFKQHLNPEFSIHNEEEKSFSNSADITSNMEVTVEASNGTKSHISSVVNYSIMSDRHSSRIGCPSVPFVSKTGSIVKSLFSRKNEPRKPQLVDAYSDMMVKESKNENTQEVIDNHSGLTCSVMERKMRQPTTRLTRSATQKGIGISDENIDKKIGVGETKERLRANRARLAHSKVHLEEEFQNVETKKVMEENTPVKYTESDSSEKIVKDQGCYVLKDQSMFASQITVGVDLIPNEEIKKIVKKETSKTKYDTKRKTCASEAKNTNNTKRLTRSAVNAVLGNKITEAISVLEENEFSEHVNTDLSPGNVTDPVNNVLETKESTSSPLYVDLTLPFTEGTHGKNMRRPSDFKVPEKTEENVAGNGEIGRGKKKPNSSSKQELRFSPRLRLLAQTRSQDKF